MGKKDSKPKSPKAPSLIKPTSITTPFGSATYNNGTYDYSSPDDGANAQTEALARTGFQNALSEVNNPQQAIQQQQSIYRNAMEPAFNQQADKDMATSIAGLGNRYAGTFGQLTAGQQAINNGIGRANLEKSIYDSGQAAYDRNLGRATTFGGINSQAQQIRMAPYNFLNQALVAGGQNTGNYNNAQNAQFGTQANIYGTQGQMYQSDQYQQAMLLQALTGLQKAAGNAASGGATGAIQGAATMAPKSFVPL